MLDTFWKLLTVPSIKVRSSTVNVVEGSLSVKVIVAVSPAFKAVLSLVIATVGRTESMVMGVARLPAVLSLPTESVKTPAATETEQGVMELVVGVNTAE